MEEGKTVFLSLGYFPVLRLLNVQNVHPAPPGEEYPQGGWAPVSGYGHSQQQQQQQQQPQQQPVQNQAPSSQEKSDEKKDGKFKTIKLLFLKF